MISLFWERLKSLPAPCRLLDCGSLLREGHSPGAAREARAHRPDVVVVGVDAREGPGVDLVADLHDLTDVILRGGNFDAVLCCSTLEHVRRPWVVAAQLARVTRPGGILFCQTHQTFPLHGYPHDYFRFSVEALWELFHADVGWHVVADGHEFPCKVVPLENAFPHAKDWNFDAEAYLNSWCLAERRA